MDALVEQARERAYHLEALVVLRAGSGTVTQEREARVMNLYQGTLAERIRTDRVDPRGKAEARKAEADLETEATEAEVDTMKDLWNHDPRKGKDSRIARRRRTARLRGSPSGAEGRRAEPLRRRLEIQTGETMTLLVKVQLQDLQEIFGMRWQLK